MKKLTIISVFAILTLSSCACLDYGVKGGLNIASVNGDNTDNLESISSAFFGGYLDMCINDQFSFRPELLYSVQGTTYDMSQGYNGHIKLDYLNMPLMGQLKISDRFTVEAGPQLGVLLAGKEEYESSGDSGEEDIKDDLETLDYGANVGLGYQLESGLNFGARYNMGLSDIWKGSGSSKNKNGVFQFSVGFRF